jgi:DNA adenine methylase
MSSNSPLRYPGGKARLSGLLKSLINENGLNGGTYCEPYAGGAGLALNLLLDGTVTGLVINDVDPGIYAFWKSVFCQADDLCEMIDGTPVDIDTWYKQRDNRAKGYKLTELELGFAVFYLNRTNRSGIIDGAGPIGGYGQVGEWKIDARFNKKRLVGTIQKLSKFSDSVEIRNDDALELLDDVLCRDQTLTYLDPPYFNKAQKLYLNHYDANDHAAIASTLRRHRTRPWLVSYDDVPEIRALYPDFRSDFYSLQYSAGRKARGNECMFFSDTLLLGNALEQSAA